MLQTSRSWLSTFLLSVICLSTFWSGASDCHFCRRAQALHCSPDCAGKETLSEQTQNCFQSDRDGDHPETQNPPAAVLVGTFRGRLHRQNQPGVCGADDESGTVIHQSAVRVRGGIFFPGHFLFEVPSNLILHKIGARVWIARILITWGAVATLTGLRSPPINCISLALRLGSQKLDISPASFCTWATGFGNGKKHRRLP